MTGLPGEADEEFVEIGGSPWDDVKEALATWRFRAVLLACAALIALAGLTRVGFDASSLASAAASLGRALYVGFDVVAEPVGGRYSFAFAWALRSAFGFLFFVSVVRPLLSLEGFAKAAVFLFALALLALAAFVVYGLYVGAGLPVEPILGG